MISTYTGKHVNPLDLRPEDICIEDIAHALACCNRFAGHTKKPISVAQHSVYVSRLLAGTPFEMQALLHDAAEAYLGDITKWIKHTPEFEAYRFAEDRVQRQIYCHFGCDQHLDSTTLIGAADKLMLRFEGEKGFGKRAWKVWSALIKYDIVSETEVARIGPWAPWSWRAAESVFLATFRSLLNDRETAQNRPVANDRPTGKPEGR